MVNSCVARNCTVRSSRGSGISFHSFPKDRDLRRQWIQAVGRKGWAPTIHSHLCSRHFRTEDINVLGERHFLRPQTVPCYFLGSDAESSPTCQPGAFKVKNSKQDSQVKPVLDKPLLPDNATLPLLQVKKSDQDSKSNNEQVKLVLDKRLQPSNATPPLFQVESIDRSSKVKRVIEQRPPPSDETSQLFEFLQEVSKQSIPYTSVANRQSRKRLNLEVSSEDDEGSDEISPDYDYAASLAEVEIGPTRTHLPNVTQRRNKSCQVSLGETTSLRQWTKSRKKVAIFREEPPSESDDDGSGFDKDLSALSWRRCQVLFKKKSKVYLGVPSRMYYMVDELQKNNLSLQQIFIILNKIKSGRSFSEIGDDVGVPGSEARDLFEKGLPIVHAKLIKHLYWPSMTKIQENLPPAFADKYSGVSCVLESFEIPVKWPVESAHYPETWSTDYRTNTLKYAVAVTPDGTVPWVSCVCGGNTSDVDMLKESNFMSVVPFNSLVMVVRGFEGVESLLKKKNCILVRLPSEETEVDVQERAFRADVERVISNVRVMKSISTRVPIDMRLYRYFDMMVQVGCVLTNLESKTMNVSLGLKTESFTENR